jgi:serine/threonine protein kinase
MSDDIVTCLVVETIVDESGNKTTRRYKRGSFLGKGGFAKCYELTDLETNKLYAAKIITKASLVKPRAKQKLKSEIKIHRSMSHSGIVKFYHHFEDKENIYILLEI